MNSFQELPSFAFRKEKQKSIKMPNSRPFLPLLHESSVAFEAQVNYILTLFALLFIMESINFMSKRNPVVVESSSDNYQDFE